MTKICAKLNRFLSVVFLLVLLPSVALANDHTVVAGATVLNPFDVVALNNKAVVRVESNDYQGALVLLERAAKIAPYNIEVQANYSRLKQWLARQDRDGVNVEAARLWRSADMSQYQEAARSFIPEPPALW